MAIVVAIAIGGVAHDSPDLVHRFFHQLVRRFRLDRVERGRFHRQCHCHLCRSCGCGCCCLRRWCRSPAPVAPGSRTHPHLEGPRTLRQGIRSALKVAPFVVVVVLVVAAVLVVVLAAVLRSVLLGNAVPGVWWVGAGQTIRIVVSFLAAPIRSQIPIETEPGRLRFGWLRSRFGLGLGRFRFAFSHGCGCRCWIRVVGVVFVLSCVL
mmetsp:Transcript_15119/g.32476  ORF Transcript_15119/g.32476 Transcript_15119/m.32476 type:complete len:208 (+) Transcript_15119:3183-3806(+)